MNIIWNIDIPQNLRNNLLSDINALYCDTFNAMTWDYFLMLNYDNIITRFNLNNKTLGKTNYASTWHKSYWITCNDFSWFHNLQMYLKAAAPTCCHICSHIRQQKRHQFGNSLPQCKSSTVWKATLRWYERCWCKFRWKHAQSC